MKQPSIDALADVRRKIVTFLRANDDFVVAAHENADGDAIGSVLAFGRLLDVNVAFALRFRRFGRFGRRLVGTGFCARRLGLCRLHWPSL